jgi:hypothetical protein
MPKPKRIGTLEVNQDLAFQRREWVVQRIGWALMFLFVAAAAAGVFGAGAAGNAVAGEPGSELWVDYERFGRRGAPLLMRVHAVASSGELRLQLDRGYLEGVRVQSVTPEPASTESAGADLVYIFRATPGQEMAVTFDLHAEQLGSRTVRVQAGGRRIEFRQFIYP